MQVERLGWEGAGTRMGYSLEARSGRWRQGDHRRHHHHQDPYARYPVTQSQGIEGG